MSNKRRNLLWVGVFVVVVVVIGSSIAWNARAGSVTGETAQDRVASVTNIAKRDGIGAANSLAQAAKSDSSPEVRRAAIVCLTRYRRPEDRPIIEAALEDEAPAVRQQAAKALVSGYDDEGVAERLTRMFNESDEADARIAAMALARSKQSAAVLTLVGALDSPPNPAAKSLAFEALDRRYRIGLDLANADDEARRYNVEIIKHIDEVRNAYEEAGIPLNRDMEIVQKMIDEHIGLCHTTEGDAPHAHAPGETP